MEIGSWKGRSTIALALGLKKGGGGKVYAVDWHMGSKDLENINTKKEFKKNIEKCGVSKYVSPMFMKSEVAAKKWAIKRKSIRFLWIDGSHEYKDVRKDFISWNPFLVEGGIIAFHDTFYKPGPSKVVDEYILRSKEFTNIWYIDQLTYAQKKRNLDRIDLLKNVFSVLLKKIIFFVSKYSPGKIYEFLRNKFI